MRPERGSAARFARTNLVSLQTEAAFAGLNSAEPLFAMAPERVAQGQQALPNDAPESVLRRMDGAGDATEYGFANIPNDPMSPGQNCGDPRLQVTGRNPNITSTVSISLRNPIGPFTFPAGTAVRVLFIQNGGWPLTVPSSCVLDETDVGRSYEYYLCSLSSPLAPNLTETRVFEFQIEAGQSNLHSAQIVLPSGVTDPVLQNNVVSF